MALQLWLFGAQSPPKFPGRNGPQTMRPQEQPTWSNVEGMTQGLTSNTQVLYGSFASFCHRLVLMAQGGRQGTPRFQRPNPLVAHCVAVQGRALQGFMVSGWGNRSQGMPGGPFMSFLKTMMGPCPFMFWKVVEKCSSTINLTWTQLSSPTSDWRTSERGDPLITKQTPHAAQHFRVSKTQPNQSVALSNHSAVHFASSLWAHCEHKRTLLWEKPSWSICVRAWNMSDVSMVLPMIPCHNRLLIWPIWVEALFRMPWNRDSVKTKWSRADPLPRHIPRAQITKWRI